MGNGRNYELFFKGGFCFGFGCSNCGSDEHVRWPILFAALRVSPELLLGYYILCVFRHGFFVLKGWLVINYVGFMIIW